MAIRTIVISGLPQPIDSKVLWKKIRKYEGAEKVDWPIKNEDGDEDPRTGSPELFFFFFLPRKLDSLILLPFLAHVLFTTPSSAFDAVNKLHAHVYKGSLISVTLKKRIDTLAKPITPLEKNSTNPTTAEVKGKISVITPSHASRLIIRNMPFNATEQDLRAIFLPYGPIFSIQIPTDDKTTKKGDDDDNDITPTTATTNKKVRTKGFAFVWMLSKKDAERAMEGCNGMIVRAGTAETLVSDKQKKKKLKRIEKKLKESARSGKKVADEEEADPDDEDEDMEKEELMDDKRANERVIAVDWALSKEKWKMEKAKIEEDAAMHEVSESEDDAEDDNSNSSDSDDEDSDDNDDDDDDDEGRLGLHDGEDEDNSDAGSEQDEEENDEERVKPQLPHPEAGTTLFIRNIPFSATEDELRTL